MLFAQAAASGLGWARLFLMWPWIEEEPGTWNFGVFDLAFDAAVRHGIRIKATLTANSGPWWLGTPSMLHSHTGFLGPDQRPPMERYIRACVERYGRHAGLGQWILWNEPNGGNERTPEALEHWQGWLRRHYSGDIAALNHRWRTGYRTFAEVQFPEDIPHPMHRGQFWNSYGPWLLDWQARAAWLNGELAWIKEIVRSIDASTELCVNPTEVLANQALGGSDLDAMARLVDVIGASYHPAWHFTFADRLEFPGLMVAGVRLEAAQPGARRVEVTEVQSGNTLNSSNRPANVTPAEVARFYLAGLAAGAESVTGWCLNVRSHDFEAGDWGLLDNQDRPSGRSRMLAELCARLDAAYAAHWAVVGATTESVGRHLAARPGVGGSGGAGDDGARAAGPRRRSWRSLAGSKTAGTGHQRRHGPDGRPPGSSRAAWRSVGPLARGGMDRGIRRTHACLCPQRRLPGRRRHLRAQDAGRQSPAALARGAGRSDWPASHRS